MSERLSGEHVAELQRCLAGSDVAIIPTDTVYGICCDPDDRAAAARLYELKGRPAERPSAVMFFALEQALDALGALEQAERRALRALLPGPVTILLANRELRFAAACGPDPATLGVRVPILSPALAPLAAFQGGLMQSSANLSGMTDPRSLAEVPQSLLEGAGLVLDGGELAGTPSTVLDLRDYAASGTWRTLREGALPSASLTGLL